MSLAVPLSGDQIDAANRVHARLKQWALKINTATLNELTGRDDERTLQIIAVFSERQHEYHEYRLDGWAVNVVPPGYKGPEVVVRSNVVNLKYVNNEWKIVK